MDSNFIFRFIWSFVRDLYAPTVSAPEAVRKTVRYASENGHEAVTCGKRWFMVDGEIFEIMKTTGHVHFDLRQHGCRLNVAQTAEEGRC